MADKRILVEHPDGRSYAVTPEAVERYEADGFVVIGPEGGAPVKRRRRRARPKTNAVDVPRGTQADA